MVRCQYRIPLIVHERHRGEWTLRRRLRRGEMFQTRHNQKLARHIGPERRGRGFGFGLARNGGEAAGGRGRGDVLPLVLGDLMPASVPSRRKATVAGIRIAPGCARSHSSGGVWHAGTKRNGTARSLPRGAGGLSPSMSCLLTQIPFRRKPNLPS